MLAGLSGLEFSCTAAPAKSFKRGGPLDSSLFGKLGPWGAPSSPVQMPPFCTFGSASCFGKSSVFRLTVNDRSEAMFWGRPDLPSSQPWTFFFFPGHQKVPSSCRAQKKKRGGSCDCKGRRNSLVPTTGDQRFPSRAHFYPTVCIR